MLLVITVNKLEQNYINSSFKEICSKGIKKGNKGYEISLL